MSSEIVFVDAGVAERQALLAGLRRGVEPVLLDRERPALGQIAAAVEGSTGLAAIHVVAHGAPGRIDFAAGGVAQANLAAHADDLAAIGAALAPGGDLMLWSCDTGSGAPGRALVDAIAEATGANVAASADPVGRGGWTLDVRNGAVAASAPLTAAGIAGFDALLALSPPTITFAAPLFPDGSAATVPTSSVVSDTSPVVLTNPDGSYRLIYNAAGAASDIYMRSFSAEGVAQGEEVRVNTYTAADQKNPAVARLKDGGFVVTWESDGQDGASYGIYSQRFSSTGVAQGDETRVNTTTTGSQIKSAVTALDNGGYVVAWEHVSSATVSRVYLQRYDSAGAAVGSQTAIDSSLSGLRGAPSISALQGGGWVVAFQAPESPGSASRDVYLVPYSATGTAGLQQRLSVSSGDDAAPSVASLADGSYVVAWATNTGSGSSQYRVAATKYAANGSLLESYTVLSGSQPLNDPQVVALADGGFVVAFEAGSGVVLGARYSATGMNNGALSLSLFSAGSTTGLAALADGGLVAAWLNNGAVNLRTYDAHFGVDEQAALNLKGYVTIGDADDSGGSYTLKLSVSEGTLTVAAGSTGVTVDSSDAANIVVTGTLAQLKALLDYYASGTVSFTHGSDTPPASVTLTAKLSDGSNETVATETIAITALNDAPGGADKVVEIDSGQAHQFSAADFGFTDVDGDHLATVIIASLPSGGTLELNGTQVALNQAIPVTSLANLVFTPADGASGDGYASFTFKVTDDGATGSGHQNTDQSANTIRFDVAAADAPPVIGDDSATVAENASARIDVLDNDSDADDALAVATVDGQGLVNPGDTVTLQSNAVVTLNADGTLTYDPSGRFNYLLETGNLSGGRTSAEDSFQYTLASGGTGTVTVTVTGVESPDDVHVGTNGDDTITGTEGADQFDLSDGGADTVHALDGNDVISFGGAFGAGDQVYGGDGDDIFAIDGDYGYYDTSGAGAQYFDLRGSQISGVETIMVGPGSDSFWLRADADLVTTGEHLTVDGSYAGTRLNFDGAAVTGSLSFIAGRQGASFTGGSGSDRFVAGAGTDYLNGHGTYPFGGADTYVWKDWQGSRYGTPDEIGYFVAGDKIDLSAVDADPITDGRQSFTLIGAAAFTGMAGELRTTMQDPSNQIVWGDLDGDRMPDFQILVGVEQFYQLSATDFILVANNDPTANDDTPTLGEDSGATVIDVLVNDSTAPDTGEALTVVAVTQPGIGGEVTLDGGVVRFTPWGDFSGFSSFSYTISDGKGGTATGTVNVTILPVDDPAVAQDDSVSTLENAPGSGSLFANNGNGADYDADGETPVIAAVNGSAGAVGRQIKLASGALLTVGADGSYGYDPNGKFDDLPDMNTSGASNTIGRDSFTYTLVGGSTATVRINVIGADSDDLVQGSPDDDIIDGGTGVNTMSYANATAGVHGNIGIAGPNDTIGAGVDMLSNFANLTGSDYADELRGSVAANILDGGLGADVMLGGNGDDTYIVDNSADRILEAAGQGVDTVRASASYILPDREVEKLVLTGSADIDGSGNRFDNVVTGNEGANSLAGYAGEDRLDGGEGADLMAGGIGNDTYVVDNAGDRIKENASEGIDTVETSVDYTLPGLEIERIVITGTGAVNVTGNAEDNEIIGNDAANSICGALGEDRIDGGKGADMMAGGLGDDVYVVDDLGDRVKERDGQGTDTVETWISWTLPGLEVENLKLMGDAALDASGNHLANIMTGNDAANGLAGYGGDDRLDGGRGADLLAGGVGNDTYVIDQTGDRIREHADEGVDTVESAISFTLMGSELENLTLTGKAADATGNMVANVLTGNDFANILLGYDGDDTLRGGDGDDQLHGMAGSDTMTGGDGADRFYFDVAPNAATNVDTITDFESGTDTIHLRRAMFGGGLAVGELPAEAFAVGDHALDAGDRVIYDPMTGALYFDPDGSGAAAAIQFATLDVKLDLSNSDFVIF